MSEGRVGAPRLLYLLNAFDQGGAEDGLVRLISGGAFEGLDLRVAALVRGADAQRAALQALGVEPTILLDRPRMRSLDLPRIALALAGLLGRIRPQAVVLSLPQANILGRLMARAVGVRLVCSFEHNTHLAKPVYERLFRWTSARVDWLLADNGATAAEAARRLYRGPPVRQLVLPLFSAEVGDEPRPTGRASPGPLRLVNAGRFTAVKNQAALIEAVALLVAEGVDVRLTLFGDGPLRPDYEALVARRGLQDRVELPGHVRGWAGRPADLFVLASRHEGLCIVLLEALAAGLPAIAPRVGGVADYGEEAQVLEAADAEPATLAQAIRRLAQDPARREAQSAAGRAMIRRRFSPDAVREAYATFNAALHGAIGPGEPRS